jgi:hypothetical protein
VRVGCGPSGGNCIFNPFVKTPLVNILSSSRFFNGSKEPYAAPKPHFRHLCYRPLVWHDKFSLCLNKYEDMKMYVEWRHTSTYSESPHWMLMASQLRAPAAIHQRMFLASILYEGVWILKPAATLLKKISWPCREPNPFPCFYCQKLVATSTDLCCSILSKRMFALAADVHWDLWKQLNWFVFTINQLRKHITK